MQERFNAEMYINHIASELGISIESMNVAPTVVMSWDIEVVKKLVSLTGAKRSKYWIYRNMLYTGKVGDNSISIAHVPVGAPVTVSAMEEMIACGAKVFIGLGYIGSLQPDLTIGSCIIPTASICEEGTSQHYINDGKIFPSRQLVKIIEEHMEAREIRTYKGKVWTTDAIYRELISKIKTYRNNGVLGVDMETSAMYALGIFRGVSVCNLLLVSDELWKEWNPGFMRSQLKEKFENVLECITDLISKVKLENL